jgi:spermidine/putrescine transport system permease protein
MSGGWWRDPWRRPRILVALTVGYLLWSLLPVLVAVLFSFNDGKSRTAWQGLSMRWYWGDPDRSVWYDDSLHAALLQTLRLGVITTLITVPLGVALAIGLDRWHGRLPSGANGLLLLSFVIPETLLAVALLFVVTNVALPVTLGTNAQVIGLVTFQISYPAILVRARLATIGTQYEEAAMDLGASPTQSLRRVLLPLLAPAIFASIAIVFATSIDNFVISQQLCSNASCQTIPILIYASARRGPLPSLNALASLALIASTILIALSYAIYRRSVRRAAGAGPRASRAALPV